MQTKKVKSRQLLDNEKKNYKYINDYVLKSIEIFKIEYNDYYSILSSGG